MDHSVKYVVILDFEANCESKQRMIELGMDNEVIEFPGILCRATNGVLEEISQFQTFCRPLVTPVLTDFCKQLTKITQEQVDNGVSFPVACHMFTNWLMAHVPHFYQTVHNREIVIMTCGDWDLSIMARKEFYLHNIYPIPEMFTRYVNIQTEFCKMFSQRRKLCMMSMLQHLDIPHFGTQHSGIDDCVNILQILRTMFAYGLAFEDLTVKRVYSIPICSRGVPPLRPLPGASPGPQHKPDNRFK